MKDAESLKQIKEGEDKKIRLQSVIQDITDINKFYLFLEKPYKVFLNTRIANLNSIQGKKTKKKNIPKNKLVFIDKFLKSYNEKQIETLKKKLNKIDSYRFQFERYNNPNSIYNFTSKLTRKSLLQ